MRCGAVGDGRGVGMGSEGRPGGSTARRARDGDHWTSGPTAGRRPRRGLPDVGCPRCAAETLHGFAPSDIDERPQVTSPEAAADLLVPEIGGHDRERCVALLLDTKHRLLTLATVSIGSVDHTFMSPREIMRDGLLANASAIVLGHNHPSGDPEPSRDDEVVTGRIVRAGEVVGVDILDHLVVGGDRWVSLARRGLV